MVLLSDKGLKQLAAGGYKLHVIHYRKTTYGEYQSIPDIRKNNNQEFIESKGGYTVVTLLDLKRQEQSEAIATCSDEDCYNRRIGITVAFQRARKWSSPKPLNVALLSPDEKARYLNQQPQ